jgi:hypothetical protein
VELPFGRGRRLVGDAPGVLNHIIGGWQTTGVFRWTSGFPANIINARLAWPTNWNLQGNAELKDGLTEFPKGDTTSNVRFPDGRVRPSIFPNPSAVLQQLRFARPGEVGFRNQIRGDGYFSVDMGLGKTFHIYESHQLQFRWEVFNLTNSVRFDTGNIRLTPDITGTFGQYFGTLTKERIMQFGLRYEF